MPSAWSWMKSLFHRETSHESTTTLTPPPAQTGEELTDAELEAIAGAVVPLPGTYRRPIFYRNGRRVELTARIG